MSEKKSKDDRHQAQRTGSVVPEDDELTTWLHRLWARNEPPERIEVWQALGRNKLDRGRMVHHEDYRPNDKLDVERANHIANEIMAVAQNDCDALGRKSWYEICVIDRNRKASPLGRLIGPLSPKRTYLAKPGNGGTLTAVEDGEDEEQSLSIGKLDLERIREANEHIRWEKQRSDRILGDVISLLGNMVQEQRTWNAEMQRSQMEFFMQLQKAKDEELDREIRRKKEELKATILRDFVHMARNLIPGMVNRAAEGPRQADGPAAPGSPRTNGAPKDHGPSPERALLDGILSDCEESKLDIVLFGEVDEQNRPVKPGIFTNDQLAVLVGVQRGLLPPGALDVLLLDSGDPRAVTPEQFNQALSVMPQSMMLGFHELFNLRQQARAAAPAPEATPSPAPSTPKAER